MEAIRYNKEENQVELDTAHGTFVVNIFDDSMYPSVSIDFKLKGREKEPPVPICLVEDADPEVSTDETPGDAVVVRVYGDCNDDEYTDRVDIPIADIREIYEEDETIVCPECEQASSEWAWNNATMDCYGDEGTGIVRIMEGNYADCLYKCPKCGKEDIPGGHIYLRS